MYDSKTDQMNLVWKSDQLLFFYIAVDRFFERTFPLDRFLHLLLDRFVYVEGSKFYVKPRV